MNKQTLDRLEQHLEHRLGEVGDRRNLSRSCKKMRHIAVNAEAKRLDPSQLEPGGHR